MSLSSKQIRDRLIRDLGFNEGKLLHERDEKERMYIHGVCGGIRIALSYLPDKTRYKQIAKDQKIA